MQALRGTLRVYDNVKLYNDGGFNDRKPWTEFEWLGHNRAGAVGEMYTIANFGEDEFVAKVDGEVWEIHLGKVINKHTPKAFGSTTSPGFEFDSDDDNFNLGRPEFENTGRYKKELLSTMPSFDGLTKAAKRAEDAATAATAAANTAKAAAAASASSSKNSSSEVQDSVAIQLVEKLASGIAEILKAQQPQAAAAPTPKDTEVRLSASELSAFFAAHDGSLGK
jgi:hypothetical protein